MLEGELSIDMKTIRAKELEELSVAMLYYSICLGHFEGCENKTHTGSASKFLENAAKTFTDKIKKIDNSCNALIDGKGNDTDDADVNDEDDSFDADNYYDVADEDDG